MSPSRVTWGGAVLKSTHIHQHLATRASGALTVSVRKRSLFSSKRLHSIPDSHAISPLLKVFNHEPNRKIEKSAKSALRFAPRFRLPENECLHCPSSCGRSHLRRVKFMISQCDDLVQRPKCATGLINNSPNHAPHSQTRVTYRPGQYSGQKNHAARARAKMSQLQRPLPRRVRWRLHRRSRHPPPHP